MKNKETKDKEKIVKSGAKKIYYLDDNLPLDVRMEGWIGRHWKQVLFFSLGIVFITTIWANYNISGLKSALENQSKAMEALAKRVIVSAPDGRVTILETVDIPDSYILFVLRDVLNRYLIYSSFELTHQRIKSAKELGEMEKVKIFATYYCGNDRSLKQFQAFLSTIWKAYKDGVLPEVIYSTGRLGEERFKIERNKFYYTVKLPVYVYVVKDGKWQRGETYIDFVLEGIIDLTKNSPYNPWGIKFTDIKASVPVL